MTDAAPAPGHTMLRPTFADECRNAFDNRRRGLSAACESLADLDAIETILSAVSATHLQLP
jgi:hypothetical protein